jgi:hypothetical protein
LEGIDCESLVAVVFHLIAPGRAGHLRQTEQLVARGLGRRDAFIGVIGAGKPEHGGGEHGEARRSVPPRTARKRKFRD